MRKEEKKFWKLDHLTTGWIAVFFLYVISNFYFETIKEYLLLIVVIAGEIKFSIWLKEKLRHAKKKSEKLSSGDSDLFKKKLSEGDLNIIVKWNLRQLITWFSFVFFWIIIFYASIILVFAVYTVEGNISTMAKIIVTINSIFAMYWGVILLFISSKIPINNQTLIKYYFWALHNTSISIKDIKRKIILNLVTIRGNSKNKSPSYKDSIDFLITYLENVIDFVFLDEKQGREILKFIEPHIVDEKYDKLLFAIKDLDELLNKKYSGKYQWKKDYLNLKQQEETFNLLKYLKKNSRTKGSIFWNGVKIALSKYERWIAAIVSIIILSLLSKVIPIETIIPLIY